MKLAHNLLANGPHKLEKISRRVRGLYDSVYVFDTTNAHHVWEHPFFSHFCIPSNPVEDVLLSKNEAVDKEESAFLATLKVGSRSTDRVLSFDKRAPGWAHED